MSKDSAAVNYVSYLGLEQILTAQTPLSTGDDGQPEHDELLFIVIHQVYELWFKQLLHELGQLMVHLERDALADALGQLRRMLVILKTVVGQVDVLETMTPLQFNSFRSFLASSSGFQSVQFRELEFALGHKRASMLSHFPEGVFGVDDLRRRYDQPTLWDVFLRFLVQRGYGVPEELLSRDVTEAIRPNPNLQTTLIGIYKTDPWLSRLCERLLDFDEGLMEWRYRHVKMVARTIGAKMGTGGSAGVKYLEKTVQPIWPDLWEIRSEL